MTKVWHRTFPAVLKMSEDNILLGGTLGGIHRRDVSERVATLLHWYPQQIELRIRPETPQADGNHHYAIDWQFLTPARDSVSNDHDGGTQ